MTAQRWAKNSKGAYVIEAFPSKGFVKIGDRVKSLISYNFRYGEWPPDTYVVKGLEGPVTELFPSDRGYDPEKKKEYMIPDGEEGKTWERIK